jgi:hypothetical protein
MMVFAPDGAFRCKRLALAATLGLIVCGVACGKHLPRRAAARQDAGGADAVSVQPPPLAALDDAECGYVDTAGKPAFGRRFDRAGAFVSGLAAVSRNKKAGFIEPRGEYAIAPTFEAAKSFRDGLAAACVAGKGWGFIDAKGAWVIPPGFEYADAFVDGVAVVRAGSALEDACLPWSGREIPAGSECEGDFGNDDDEADGRYFLIDRAGRRLHEKGYHCITRMSEGLAAARRKDQWGYLNREGQLAISARFVRAKPFGEGWAAVFLTDRARQEGDADSEGKWGFIDLRGRFVTQVKYRASEVGVFSHGLVAMEGVPSKTLLSSPVGRACLGSDERHDNVSCGVYLDKKGQVRIAVPYCGFSDAPKGYRSLREFSGGFAEVVMEEPIRIQPFECAPALMGVVSTFVDPRGNFEPPAGVLLGRAPEGVVPKCRSGKPTKDVQPFIWR